MTDVNAKVLIVDDDESFLRLFSMRLEGKGYRTFTAGSARSALEQLPSVKPDIVIADLRMDGMDGIGLLSELQKRYPGLPVLLLTAHGTIPDAVAATRTGAFGFLTKPVDHDELQKCMSEALSLSPVGGDGGEDWRAELVTRNAAMEELLDTVRRLAPTRSTVLIRGPSGSGKEVLARVIHKASGREGDFVAFNCAAIPSDLLESELFGYRKGAFTGATRNHPGLFEQAHKGTLLLDEIGDMPKILQAKVLRVLEDGQVRPLGSEQVIDVDARIVAATNRNLEEAIEAGEFREDLFYRLNVVSLELPPLSERIEDIPLLVTRRLQYLAEQSDTPRKTFSSEAMDLLMAQKWPGNVRQLQNVVDQTVALAPSRVISAEIVESTLGAKATKLPSLSEARDEFMRGYLIQLLAATEGNVTRASRLAQRNRTDFHKLLAKHDIDAAAFKA
ncbi:MAG TPA: sigma 54-interacting transcriptional regulator [Arenicellales bacterium]|nr:sigma 54-interacting transcriptional regulator [Arenicellales bacterium]